MSLRNVSTVAIFGLIVVVAAVVWSRRQPVELIPLSSEPIDMIDATGGQMRLLKIQVRNLRTSTLEFAGESILGARVANHWVDILGRWGPGRLAGRGAPRSTSQVLLVIPVGAEAYRLQLQYRYIPGQAHLPLGIRNTWARFSPPSPLSRQVQNATSRVLPGLYNWLWPMNSGTPSPYWKTTTPEVMLPPYLSGNTN